MLLGFLTFEFLLFLVFNPQHHHKNIHKQGETIGSYDGDVFALKAINDPKDQACLQYQEHDQGNIVCFFFS